METEKEKEKETEIEIERIWVSWVLRLPLLRLEAYM